MPGVGLNPYGFSLNFKYEKETREKAGWQFGDWYFETGNIMNPREIALVNQTLQNSGIYKYGKINYAWTLRNYYMARMPLSVREDRKNVALNAILGAGVPVCYFWPVYINYFDPDLGPGGSNLVVRYNPEVHKQEQIAGRAAFTRGLRQGSVIPGAGLNTGIEFVWGNYRSDVKVVTLGARLEGYAKTIPILYRSDMNHRLFSMFYINFALGFGKN